MQGRYLTSHLLQDLKSKMVFLGGPRQVGKTTLAQSFIRKFHEGHLAYMNYDYPEHARRIRNQEWPDSEQIIIFDELHKMKNWRGLIKGYYDILKNKHQFLVTGSARLDYFRKGGDSLLGRYRYYRLHPFSVAELNFAESAVYDLLTFGGFPEPLFERDSTNLRRWHTERLYRLIYSDLRDIERVSDIDKVHLLAEELPVKVGSPLSIKSLAEDLQVDFKTVKRWLTILDTLYYSYQLAPYGSPKIRAVKKEQKLYLWDWSSIQDTGIRFENMVASQLLKYCHFLQDTQGYRTELRYLRDTDKREIDFVVLSDKKPLFAVEAKLTKTKVSQHLSYFADRTDIPAFYQVHSEPSGYQSISEKISVMPFAAFCKKMKMP